MAGSQVHFQHCSSFSNFSAHTLGNKAKYYYCLSILYPIRWLTLWLVDILCSICTTVVIMRYPLHWESWRKLRHRGATSDWLFNWFPRSAYTDQPKPTIPLFYLLRDGSYYDVMTSQVRKILLNSSLWTRSGGSLRRLTIVAGLV
jgi:hypothetical protein